MELDSTVWDEAVLHKDAKDLDVLYFFLFFFFEGRGGTSQKSKHVT